MGLIYKGWNFNFGVQIPLYDDNQNAYQNITNISGILDSIQGQFNLGVTAKVKFPSEWGKYFNSNQLKRGPDVLIRAEKNFRIKKFDLSPGLLGIYRISGDKYTPLTGTETKIAGSEGLTLNITGGIKYRVTNHIVIDWLMGFPVVVRKYRADGLTRHFATSLGVTYKFSFRKKVKKRFNLNTTEH